MASKPILITGGVVCLISASLLLVAGSFTNQGVESLEDLEEIEYNVYDYYYGSYHDGEEATDITFEFIDEDGQGSMPWIVMVRGDYSDTNEDSQIDVCEGLTLVIHDSNGTNLTNEKVGHLECDVENEPYDADTGDGLADIGFICDTIYDDQNCKPGQILTVTLYDENNSKIPFTLYDADASIIAFFGLVGEEAAEGVAALIGASMVGFLSCCGICFGLVIFFLGLVIGGNPPDEVEFVYKSLNSESFETQLNVKNQINEQPSESKDEEWWDGIVEND